MTTTTTELQQAAPAKQRTIQEWLTGENFKNQVALALPKHITPDRFVRVALTAMGRTPKLAQCDKTSFFNSLLTLSQLGLEPDGRLAHLIPYNNRKKQIVECQLIVDYKGLVDLAMRSDRIANIHADKICANDVFVYNVGVVEKHEINFREPRGDAYAYYAQVTFKDGTKKADVMTLDEVKAIQQRSRAGGDGPWITDFHEMGKKTVFRRLSKWLPLSAEYRDALGADADALEEKRFASAAPAQASVIPNFEYDSGDIAATNAPTPEDTIKGSKEATWDTDSSIKAQVALSEALIRFDFAEERFVAGLRLLHVEGIAKQAKVVADLSDAVCETIFSEGLNGIIATIQDAEALRNEH